MSAQKQSPKRKTKATRYKWLQQTDIALQKIVDDVAKLRDEQPTNEHLAQMQTTLGELVQCVHCALLSCHIQINGLTEQEQSFVDALPLPTPFDFQR